MESSRLVSHNIRISSNCDKVRFFIDCFKKCQICEKKCENYACTDTAIILKVQRDHIGLEYKCSRKN